MNQFDNLGSGKNPPNDIYAVIEISKDSKYKI